MSKKKPAYKLVVYWRPELGSRIDEFVDYEVVIASRLIRARKDGWMVNIPFESTVSFEEQLIEG